MALSPLSTRNNKKASPLGNSPARPAAPGGKGNGSMGKAVIVFIIVAVVIGIFVFINKSNTEQRNEAARVDAQNKKIQAENEAQKKAQAQAEEKAQQEKQAKKEAAALAAKQARENKRARQENQTENAGEAAPADDTPPADEAQDDQGDAGDTPAGEDGTEAGEDNGGEDDAGDDAASGEGELDISLEADKDPANGKRLLAKARQAAESGEYEDFASMLQGKLTEAYPDAMKTEAGALPRPISKSNMGETARKLYLCTTLAMEATAEASGEERKAFMTWLLASKQKPGITFVKYLDSFKVAERADAVEKMAELHQTYKDEPKKAFGKIKAIANPLDHNVSKKLYPHSKKDIATTITKLKNTKQAGTLDADQRDAVNLVNVYRYLCGLPPTVVYDKTYHKEATEAAEACKAAGHIAHDLGHHTNQCNLFAGVSGPPSQTVSGYMSDNGENNRQARGHRAWILYPGTGKTAFGKVDAYQAMRTMDGSSGYRAKKAWSYPGRGYYPLEYMHGTGWSYYCAPGTAMPESESQVKIEMWSVPKGLKSAPQEKRLTKANAIPVLNTYVHLGAYMPTGNTIVFEPDYSKMKPQDNKPTGTYWVRITWPGYKDEYVVEFY